MIHVQVLREPADDGRAMYHSPGGWVVACCVVPMRSAYCFSRVSFWRKGQGGSLLSRPVQ